MAEKFGGTKLNSKLQTGHSSGDKINLESDKAFLDRNHVVPLMRELLENLYTHQPEKPLDYIYT